MASHSRVFRSRLLFKLPGLMLEASSEAQFVPHTSSVCTTCNVEELSLCSCHQLVAADAVQLVAADSVRVWRGAGVDVADRPERQHLGICTCGNCWAAGATRGHRLYPHCGILFVGEHSLADVS